MFKILYNGDNHFHSWYIERKKSLDGSTSAALSWSALFAKSLKDVSMRLRVKGRGC